MKKRVRYGSTLAAAIVLTSGCATVATIEAADDRTARVFSGTRLDFLAITGQPIPSRSFRADPPRYPLLDLPFSVVLDVVVLPLTLGFGLNVSR